MRASLAELSRVSKTDSSGTSSPITDGTEPASPVLKDARAVYTPGLSERASGTSKFYHGDALGSTRGITNSSQTVTDSVLYDAFGMTVSRTGSTVTPFGFVGAQQYQSDSDSGLMLLGHRMYDPSIGRFISSDPAKAGTNWYGYCESKPLSNTDDAGLDLIPTRPTPRIRFINWVDGLRNGILDGLRHLSGSIVPNDPEGCGCDVAPKLPKPKSPKIPNWPNRKVGEAIGWGDGEKEALDRVSEINEKEIARIKETGIARDTIEKWRDFYRDYTPYLDQLGRKSQIGTPDARAHLLTKILHMWTD